MKKTKIICTIGPASEDEATLTTMAKVGMDVARFNFSHGSHEEHQKRFDTIKRIREKISNPIPIMLDTKGPEFRIGTFKEHKINLSIGDEFTFTTKDVEGDSKIVSVSYKNLAKEIKSGQTILVNNGLLAFEVKEVKNKTDIVTVCKAGGVMSDRKSMHFPCHVTNMVFLSEQDKSDILFGLKNGISFVAASFVSTGEDVKSLRDFLDANGGEAVEIISKIENQSGIDNIDDILKYSDGVMVARGDLGVEVAYEQLPSIQKFLIKKCRAAGRRVVTATEMLESMISNPRPTRAEISDVANAVYDGSSAVMLSGESAAGLHPVEAVETMAKICESTEKSIDYIGRFRKTEFETKDGPEAIAHAACDLAIDIKAKAIIVCSKSGASIKIVSRFRPPMPIIGMTTTDEAYRKTNLNWGVIPTFADRYQSTDVMYHYALLNAKKLLNLRKGDRVIVAGGPALGGKGTINTIKLEVIE